MITERIRLFKEAEPLSPDEEKRQGVEAEAILRNPLFRKAFKRVMQAYVDRLINTEAEHALHRELLWYQIRALALVRRDLTQMVNSGKLITEQERLESESDDSPGDSADRDPRFP